MRAAVASLLAAILTASVSASDASSPQNPDVALFVEALEYRLDAIKSWGTDRAGKEDGMPEIGDGLIAIADGIALRHGRHAEPRDLREDVPDPVALLPARLQFGKRCVVFPSRLRIDETLKVERVVAHCPHITASFRGRSQTVRRPVSTDELGNIAAAIPLVPDL